MDDAARAPQSEFSGSSDDARERFERAAARSAEGVDASQVAEAMLEGADPTRLCEDERWESLPHAVQLEGWLQVAWAAAERDDDELTLSAATRALELEPADERALAIAEPLWLESDAFATLADRFALAATSAGSEERARQLLERALHMLEGTPAAAPAMVGLSERLAQLSRLRDGEESLLAVLKSGGADASAALVKLGERWLKDGRANEALVALPRDLSAFHGEAAQDLLERLFDQADDSERLAEVLQRRVELASSALARGRALDKLAELEHERRGNLAAAAGAWLAAGQAFLDAGERDDAERAYERLLGMLPEHLNAAARLVSLRAASGNFGGVTEAFGVLLSSDAAARQAAELLLSIAPDAERACAADELAELSDSVLWRLSADDQELSERLLRESARLFAAQDRYDEAADLYRRLVGDRAAPEDRRAFQALIDSNPASEWRQGQQRWLFEWREHHDPNRATVLREWARFEETEVGDPIAAASVLARAVELAPERADIWQQLARLRLAGGDSEGGLAAAEALRRLDQDVDQELLGAVLEHEPGARWAVDRLKLTLSSEGRWPELFELYDRAIAATPSAPERAAWLDEAAIAARDVAQDGARAVRYWQAHAELEPGDARVDLALERLYEQTGDRVALVAHLTTRLARSTPEQQLRVEQRIVTLSLELGALDEALAAILRLQSLAPDQVEPLLEATFARSAELWSEPQARKAGQECAEMLRASYLAGGKPERVADVLRAELALPLEFRERCARLTELSRLCERELGDLPGAFGAARDAFAATLQEAERQRAEKLAKKLGAWSELCEMYAQTADSELPCAQRRELLQRAANVATEPLRDPSRALACYEALFELEPDAALSVLETVGDDAAAFEALCRVLTRARRFEQLSRALQERTARAPEAALFSRLGRLQAEELSDPLGAIGSHLQANDARAAGEVFLRQPSVFREDGARALELAAHLDDVGLPEGALRVLRHQLAYFGEHFPPARKPVQLALVRALESSGEREPAQELLTEAAKRYATDADVQWACAAAAAVRRDWERAEQCYRTLLLLLHGTSGGGTSLRRATVYVELAALKRTRGDAPAAEQLVVSGFEAALSSTEELCALARALVAHQLWEPAERAAVQLLQRDDDPGATAAALEALAALRGNGALLADDVLKRAESAATQLSESATARERVSLLCASLAFLPLSDAHRLLAQVEAELGAEDALRARLQIARRLLDQGDGDARIEAIARLEALVSHPEATDEAWQLLARAWELAEDAESLSRTLEAWLERSPMEREVLARALELALKRSELERALSLFERLERGGAEPATEQALRLAALCVSGGEPRRAVGLLRGEAAREPKAVKRAALLVEAAELLQTAGEARDARDAATEAKSVDPASPEATLLLAQLELAAGEREAAALLLSSYAESKERRRGKGLSRILRLAADLHLQRDELAEALPLLVEAHQLDKTDLDTALLLGLLAIDLDRLETAASALRVLVAQRELGPRESAGPRALHLANGYFHLARIEQHHGKKTNAKRMALRALEENPQLTSAKRLLDELSLH